MPISLALKGVQGNLNLTELIADQEASGKGIKPFLEKLDIDDLALNINEVPYELPSFSLSEVDFSQKTNKISALLTTSEGQGYFEANLSSLNPLLGQIDFWDTDLQLVKRWWSEIHSGKAKGTLWLEEEGLRAEAEFNELDTGIIGIAIDNVAGKINYKDSQLMADLTGQIFGGEVMGHYNADFVEKRWQGELKGPVQLANTIVWLNDQAWLPFAQSFLNVRGQADVSIIFLGGIMLICKLKLWVRENY